MPEDNNMDQHPHDVHTNDRSEENGRPRVWSRIQNPKTVAIGTIMFLVTVVWAVGEFRVATMVNDLRSNWQKGDRVGHEAAYERLKRVDPSNIALSKYSGPILGGDKIHVFNDHVDVVCVSGDNVISYSRSTDDIYIHSISTGGVVQTLSGQRSPILMFDMSDEHVFATTKDNDILIWNSVTGKLLRTLTGHQKYVMQIEVDSDHLISASLDNTVKIWNISTGKLVRTLKGHRSAVFSISVVDGYVVSGSFDRTIKIWSLATGEMIRTLVGHTGSIDDVTVSGDYIISGSSDNTLKIWRLSTGALIRTIKGCGNDVFSISLSDDRVVSGKWNHYGGYERTIYVWRLSTGEQLRTLKGHRNTINSVAVSGNYVVSGSKDWTIKVWDLGSGEIIRSFGDRTIVRMVHVSDKYIVSRSYAGVSVWRAPW
jgi:WD40 repeat protein